MRRSSPRGVTAGGIAKDACGRAGKEVRHNARRINTKLHLLSQQEQPHQPAENRNRKPISTALTHRDTPSSSPAPDARLAPVSEKPVKAGTLPPESDGRLAE